MRTSNWDDLGVSGTPLRGRDDDVAAALDLLATASVRLVTLTGRGGVGKTAVAREVARRLATDRSVSVVRLDGIRDPDLVPAAVAAAVGVAPANVDLLAAVAARLGGAGRVVVLDNFEHVQPAAPWLSDLLARAEGLQLLVTSQTALRLRAEHVVALRPLAVPAAGARSADLVRDVPSVRLYCDRAAAVDHSFRLDDGNAAAVAQLCRRLEGLPLAIELAAARAATLPAGDILTRLDAAPLDLLRRPRVDAPERHHALRDAIAWTTGLLDNGQLALLWRLSVVTGPFGLDVVEALSPTASALDDLSALVDVHLVDPVPSPAEAAYVLPAAIRAYAEEQLRAEGADAATRAAHRQAAAAWARAATAGAATPEEPLWLARLAARYDDLVECLAGAIEAGSPGEALDLANGLAEWWSATGYHVSHDRLLRSALDLAADRGVVSAAHAAALGSWAFLAVQHQLAPDVEERLAALASAEAMALEGGDIDVRLHVLMCRMLVSPYDPDPSAATAAGEEGLRLAALHGSARWVGAFEVWNGMLAHQAGDTDRAVELGLRGLACAREAGDDRTIALAAMLLFPLVRSHPAVADVVPTTTEALELARRSGHRVLADVFVPAAVADALATGDLDTAGALLLDALLAARTGPKALTGFLLVAAARWLSECGDLERVAWLEGVLAPDLALLDATSAAEHVRIRRRVFAAARAALPDGGEAARLRAEGVSWQAAAQEVEGIVRDHLSARADAEDEPAGSSSSRQALTPRQAEVLRLAAAGLSNREIADALGLAPKTVMHHLNAVYLSLGVRGRTEAAAWAFRNGVVS